MILTIDGKQFPLPRIPATIIVAVLDLQHQIQKQGHGHIIIDFSPQNVAIRVFPAVRPIRKDIDNIASLCK